MDRDMLSIKNNIPTLIEWGKIKIGRKGRLVRKEFHMPVKLDHFIITTLEKSDGVNYDIDEELTNKLNKKLGTEKLKEIPVVLQYNDPELNFITRYVCYHGRKRYCSGNGEKAYRFDSNSGKYNKIDCPCEKISPEYNGEDGSGKGKCRKSGCLSVVIQDVDIVGGAWKFRTCGSNSVDALMGSLFLIKYQTGGLLANIPLSMIIKPKTATNPIDGSNVTIYVVTLVYKGSLSNLREKAISVSKEYAECRLLIDNAETNYRKLLTASEESLSSEVTGDEIDFVEEFIPEETMKKDNKAKKGKKKKADKKSSEVVINPPENSMSNIEDKFDLFD